MAEPRPCRSFVINALVDPALTPQAKSISRPSEPSLDISQRPISVLSMLLCYGRLRKSIYILHYGISIVDKEIKDRVRKDEVDSVSVVDPVIFHYLSLSFY
jgi:hypothetical protein